MKVLIIDDDERIREELCSLLCTENFIPETITSFHDVQSDIERIAPDIIILDLGLPENSGFSILRVLRKKYSIPVIVLTSQSGDTEEILSMNMGADDFISKPFNPEILMVRINAILRRMSKQEEIGKLRNLTVNFTSGKVRTMGEPVKETELTRNEIKILNLLMKRRGAIVSRDDLIEELWNYNEFIDDNTLTVNVTRLKKKLEELGEKDVIRTRKGMGYIIDETD